MLAALLVIVRHPYTRWQITGIEGRRPSVLPVSIVVATMSPVVIERIEQAAANAGIKLKREES